MMDEAFIRKRITELRIKKGVSEYKMSTDIGHSKSYMQGISSGRMLPSWPEFFYICDYFGVTPSDFFDEQQEFPALINQAVSEFKRLSESDMRLVLVQINRLLEK